MKSSLTLITLALVGYTMAYDNNPPIPDRLPGQGVEFGLGNKGIDVELIYDLTCPDSKAMYNSINDLVKLPFMDGKVNDAV